MRILAVDVGTGTQDILVFDSDRRVENNVKLILPSATEIAARRIRRAGEDGHRLILSGVLAGGGPCHWALEAFLNGGGTAFATTAAAQTFDDDLTRVEAMGVTIVGEDEANGIAGEHVMLGDLDLEAIRTALDAFEEPIDFDGLALGCLDHGAAPPDVSDRTFRFEHLKRAVSVRNDLLAFATAPEDLPDYLTRARALCRSAGDEAPIAFMDTGPAAALGALHDERVAKVEERVLLNLGNMHLLAFHLRGRQIASLYEHHTGEVSLEQIVAFTRELTDGTLRNEEIFGSKGHGAFHADRSIVAKGLPLVAATGPQRDRIAKSALTPLMAAPYGDMMIGGCFGLLRAFAEVHPSAADAVESRLGPL